MKRTEAQLAARRRAMVKYRKNHPERVKTSVDASRAKKPEKYKRYMREWRAANNDRTVVYSRRWRKLNPKKYCDVARRWWRTPNGRAYVQRRSMIRRAMGEVSTITLRRRFEFFGDACVYCGRRRALHVDHVLAITRGGGHEITNLVPACRRCNLSKNDSQWETWYAMQPFYDPKRAARIRAAL